MGKNTRVRQRLSSSDDSTAEFQKPPTQRRLHVEAENDEDDDTVEDKISKSSSEEDDEESAESLVEKLVQMTPHDLHYDWLRTNELQTQ